MPTSKIKFGSGYALVMHQNDWNPGDQPPTDDSDYLGWFAWAEVQHKAGLRQKECGKCGLWKYPQELSSETIKLSAHKGKHMLPVKIIFAVCNSCAVKNK